MKRNNKYKIEGKKQKLFTTLFGGPNKNLVTNSCIHTVVLSITICANVG